MIDNTQYDYSLNDTTNLRKLILENPDLPILIFAGEEAWQGIWHYNQIDAREHGVEELTLYKDVWMTKEDYRERLVDDLSIAEEYKNLTDKEYFKMIDQKIEETAFCKAIVLYVG